MTTINAANAVRTGLYADAERTKQIIILGTVLGFVVSAFVTFMVGASIVRPIKSITDVMQQLSAGKTDVEIGHRDRRDEIGKMVRSHRRVSQEHDRNPLDGAGHAIRPSNIAWPSARAAMHELAAEFEKSVQQIAKELTDAVGAMHTNAEAMSLIAAQTRDKSQSTAGIVIDTQTNVDSVADAAEELAKSIELLAAQTHNARELTNKTVAESASASANVQQLLDAVSQIVPITGLIQAIAQQTNLLGAQCHDRGGARGQRRQRLCRGRRGSQIAGATDRESDRGDQSEDRRGERLVRRGRRHHGAGDRRDRPARRRHHGNGERRSASRRPPPRKSPRTRNRPPTARALSPATLWNWTRRRARTTTHRARRSRAPNVCSITRQFYSARSTISCATSARRDSLNNTSQPIRFNYAALMTRL